MKKIIFWIMILFFLLAMFAASFTQSLPMLAYACIAYLDIYKNKNMRELLVAFSIMMFVINAILIFSNPLSLVDVVFWGLAAVANYLNLD